MPTRHNLCPNPAASINTTSWTGGSAPARVTGLVGYQRSTGARYTAGGYLIPPASAANPGDTVTISLDILTEVFDEPTVDLYVYATRSAGGDVQVGAVEHTSLVHGVVSRLAVTRTLPALTTGVYLVVDSINMVISPTVATAVLVEIAAAADTYFDGDSPGAFWDGTIGLSPSTLPGDPPPGPTPEWSAGEPYTTWRASEPHTPWTAGNPYTTWRARQPRGGG